MENEKQLQRIDDQTPSTFQQGELNEHGLICKDGTFIPRYKRENRKGLTDADEELIASQVKAFKAANPHMELAVIDMIMLWNFRDPSGCETYVKDKQLKKKNITAEDLKREMEREKFPEMKEYERVY